LQFWPYRIFHSRVFSRPVSIKYLSVCRTVCWRRRWSQWRWGDVVYGRRRSFRWPNIARQRHQRQVTADTDDGQLWARYGVVRPRQGSAACAECVRWMLLPGAPEPALQQRLWTAWRRQRSARSKLVAFCCRTSVDNDRNRRQKCLQLFYVRFIGLLTCSFT